jgi:uncharacterized protein (DUF4415 family)
MTKQWPSFVTGDLGDSAEDDAEMLRRWKVYDERMKALIAAGGIHQDADGWWVDDKTGDLIGPDPELERPRTDEELSKFKPFAEVHPDLYESIKRARGRPPVASPRRQISIRLDPDVIEKFKATGKGWQNRINEVLKQAKI